MDKIEEALNKNEIYITKTQGDSMYPMLKENNSLVAVEKPTFPLKKYDVPVYRRDGHYTMHRIVRVKKGRYIICGDNRIRLERDITEADIVGVLKGYYTDGEYVSCTDEKYLKYAKKVCRGYYKRCIKVILKKIMRKIKRIMISSKA